jgi:ribosomal protein S18 acetylase RimI-like enzyme
MNPMNYPGRATLISFRPAHAHDFDYCASLYFAGMEEVIRQLKLDMAAQVASFRRQWVSTEVRIIALDRVDVGWLQSRVVDGSLFLAQLFVNATHQRQGIGTEVLSRIGDEAARACQAVTLGVVKTNPALRLYERLGFRVTHEDDRKFYMRREASTALRDSG